MPRPIKCNVGNRACGRRCIPESYTCASDKQKSSQEQTIKPASTVVPVSPAQITAPSPIKASPINITTSKSEALHIQKMQQEEAYALAGGKSQYKKELASILSDTGAGIKATITRDAMRFLAPNLIRADDLNLYLQVKKTGAYEKQIYNPDRKKFKMSDIIRDGDVLKKGDIVRVRFPAEAVAGGFGYHYGVYLGNGRLIQYNKIKREVGKKRSDTSYAGIHESHFKDVNKEGTYKWEKVKSTNIYSPEELQSRVDKVRDTKIKYNMYNNNCEHFAYLLTQGKAYSSQIDVSSGVAAKIIEGFFYYFQNQVLRKKAGLIDKIYDNEFKTVKNLQFSENKSNNDTFQYPTNIKDVATAFTRAITYAQFMDTNPEIQTKILASWLQEYLYRLTY